MEIYIIVVFFTFRQMIAMKLVLIFKINIFVIRSS